MSECRYCGRREGVLMHIDEDGVCDVCASNGEPGEDAFRSRTIYAPAVRADGTDAGNPASDNDPGE